MEKPPTMLKKIIVFNLQLTPYTLKKVDIHTMALMFINNYYEYKSKYLKCCYQSDLI